MEIWQIVLISIGSAILFLFLLMLLVGALVIIFSGHIHFVRKVQKRNKSVIPPQFEFQLDYDWLNTKDFFRYITITSFDNKQISALFHFEKKSHMFLVFAHGFTGSPGEKAKCIHELYDYYHCNIVLLKQRGHSNSKITFLTMGYREGKDIVSWTNYIKEYDKESEIVTYGESMGGATVLYGLEWGYNSNVKCVVEDCSFSSISSVYDFTGKHFVPGFISKFGVFGTVVIYFLFFRMRVIKYSPKNAVKKANIPVCFIHGEEDEIVPYESFNVFKNTVNKSIYSQFESFPKATHASSYYYDHDRYMNVVTSFINKYISK